MIGRHYGPPSSYPEEAIPIETLKLQTRTINWLKRSNVHYISEITSLSDEQLMALPRSEQSYIDDIHKQLNSLGLD